MELLFNSEQIAFINWLVQTLEEGNTHLHFSFDPNGEPKDPTIPDFPIHEWRSFLWRLRHYGAIEDFEFVEGAYCSFRIRPKILEIEERINAAQKSGEKPRDIVEDIKESAKSNPFVARLIIASIVVSAILVPVAAMLTIIEKVVSFLK